MLEEDQIKSIIKTTYQLFSSCRYSYYQTLITLNKQYPQLSQNIKLHNNEIGAYVILRRGAVLRQLNFKDPESRKKTRRLLLNINLEKLKEMEASGPEQVIIKLNEDFDKLNIDFSLTPETNAILVQVTENLQQSEKLLKLLKVMEIEDLCMTVLGYVNRYANMDIEAAREEGKDLMHKVEEAKLYLIDEEKAREICIETLGQYGHNKVSLADKEIGDLISIMTNQFICAGAVVLSKYQYKSSDKGAVFDCIAMIILADTELYEDD